MKTSVSVGISGRQSMASWGAFAAALEAEGVDRIWLIDSQVSMKDMYVGLVVAALSTARIELGSGVTNVITRHPSVTANAIAAVAEVSSGRAILGLGAGDSAVHGIGKAPSKIDEMGAALEFFRAVLGGEEGTWAGRRFALPFPAKPVKLYVAASQRRMCTLGGRLADGVILMGPAQPDVVRRQVEWVREGVKEAGASHHVEVSFIATTSVSDDPHDAVEHVRAWATGQARLLADFAELPEGLTRYRAELDAAKEAYTYREHLSTYASHGRVISDELVRELAVAGPPADCAGRLTDLLACGVDSLIFPLVGRGRLERLRTLERRLFPLIERRT